VLVDHKRTITFLTQEVEKLKLSHKDTVDRLQLELLLASNNTTYKGGDDVTRVLHQEPGTPFISGGFNNHAMASLEARSDQGRGSAHICESEGQLG